MSQCCIKCRPTRHIDSAWSWVVVIAATVSILVLVGIINCYAVVMPVLMGHFHETRQTIAWVGSIAQGLTFFASPLAAVFIDKFNFRITALIGACACVVGLVITSFTQTTLHVFLSYSLLYGLGSCFVFMSCVYAVTAYFEKRQSLALGLASSGANVGVLSMGPLLQVLLDKFGWRVMYRIMAAVAGLVLLLVTTFEPNVMENPGQPNPTSPRKHRRTETFTSDPEHSIGLQPSNKFANGDVQSNTIKIANGRPVVGEPIPEPLGDDRYRGLNEGEPVDTNRHQVEAAPSRFSMFKETLRTPVFVIALVTITMEAGTGFVSYVHLVKYCEEVGIQAQDASNLFIFIGVASFIAAPITGRILDIATVNPFHVNQAAAVVTATSMLLLQLATEYQHFIIFAVFLGVGLGSFCTTLLVLLLRTVPSRLRIFSYPIGQLCSSFGNMSGPPLVGFIADRYGSYRPAYYTAGGIMLLSAFVPFLQYCFKPWREKPADDSPNVDNKQPRQGSLDRLPSSNSDKQAVQGVLDRLSSCNSDVFETIPLDDDVTTANTNLAFHIENEESHTTRL